MFKKRLKVLFKITETLTNLIVSVTAADENFTKMFKNRLKILLKIIEKVTKSDRKCY